MRELIDEIAKRLSMGQRVVAVTVIAREGSAPRGVGASMLICEDGAQIATIGGGMVEHQASQRAKRMLTNGERADIQVYELAQGEEASIGMACGGRVSALFCRYEPDAETIALFDALKRHISERNGVYLIVPLDGANAFDAYYEITQDDVLYDPGRDPNVNRHFGSAPVTASVNGASYYIEPLDNLPRALVFGGGHVSRALVPLLDALDFEVTLYEDRLGFTAHGAFSRAKRIICKPYSEIERHLPIWRGDYVIVMTHGHEADFEVLCQVLDKGAGYVGCIGSKRKNAFVRERLLQAGFSEATADAIHSPIGLAIGAETPQEIAVSIAAELIACRAAVG